jgi:hypothetical protein
MRLLAAAMAVLLLVSGCSRAESGRPIRAPGGPAAGSLDLSLMSTGNLPVHPLAPLGAAGNAAQGAALESRRIADSVVGPWDVDPALVVPGTARALVLADAGSLTLIEPRAVADVAQAHGLIAGFAADRLSEDGQRLVNAVLRLSNPDSARTAVTEMAAAVASATNGSPTSVPGHPETSAVAFTSNAEAAPGGPITLYAFTSRGDYVSCQIANAESPDAAAALIAHTVDLQIPRIDAITPTDPAELARLPLDPTGLLAHTSAPYNWPYKDTDPIDPEIGVYSPDAALNFQDDPLGAAPAFDAAGLKSMAHNAATVYQTRDSGAAGQLTDDLADLVILIQPDARPVNGVDFLPGSRCVQYGGSGAGPEVDECLAAAGAFTIEVRDGDLIGAHQRTAAQYKMLASWG